MSYVPDARGRGLSDQRMGLGHTTGDYARDAAGLIEELGLAPAVVIGHSMGARASPRASPRPARTCFPAAFSPILP